MSLFTKVTATALALISFTAPALADNSFAAHEALVQTIRDAGVEVYLNTPPQVCGDNIDGAYISGVDALVICQDNGVVGGPRLRGLITTSTLCATKHNTWCRTVLLSVKEI